MRPGIHVVDHSHHHSQLYLVGGRFRNRENGDPLGGASGDDRRDPRSGARCRRLLVVEQLPR